MWIHCGLCKSVGWHVSKLDIVCVKFAWNTCLCLLLWKEGIFFFFFVSIDKSWHLRQEKLKTPQNLLWPFQIQLSISAPLNHTEKTILDTFYHLATLEIQWSTAFTLHTVCIPAIILDLFKEMLAFLLDHSTVELMFSIQPMGYLMPKSNRPEEAGSTIYLILMVFIMVEESSMEWTELSLEKPPQCSYSTAISSV